MFQNKQPLEIRAQISPPNQPIGRDQNKKIKKHLRKKQLIKFKKSKLLGKYFYKIYSKIKIITENLC